MSVTTTAIKTVNVLEVREADPLNVIRLTSYPDTPAGRHDARKDFVETIREAKEGLHKEKELEEILIQSINEGVCEVGEGYIAYITSQ